MSRALELADQVSNWGRWGEDDQRGTLNLLDVRKGIEAVVTAEAFPLAMPLKPGVVQSGYFDRRIEGRRMRVGLHEPINDSPDSIMFSDETMELGVQASTHWDALPHASWRGRCWNGRPASTVDENGAAFSGIDKTGPIVGRGVLLDLARTAGVDRLEGGTAVGPDELDAAVDAAGVELAPGDILLLRTGHITVLPDTTAYLMTCPGPSVETAPWFRRHDVAAVATDSLAFEVYPNGDEVVGMPLHALNLVMIGLTQGQNFWLEDLASACAADGRYTFLLSATPLPFANALGGPVAPVAVK